MFWFIQGFIFSGHECFAGGGGGGGLEPWPLEGGMKQASTFESHQKWDLYSLGGGSADRRKNKHTFHWKRCQEYDNDIGYRLQIQSGSLNARDTHPWNLHSANIHESNPFGIHLYL